MSTKMKETKDNHALIIITKITSISTVFSSRTPHPAFGERKVILLLWMQRLTSKGVMWFVQTIRHISGDAENWSGCSTLRSSVNSARREEHRGLMHPTTIKPSLWMANKHLKFKLAKLELLISLNKVHSYLQPPLNGSTKHSNAQPEYPRGISDSSLVTHQEGKRQILSSVGEDAADWNSLYHCWECKMVNGLTVSLKVQLILTIGTRNSTPKSTCKKIYVHTQMFVLEHWS